MQQWRLKNVQIVTSNYVLLELVALFTNPLRIPRFRQIETIETLKDTTWVEIVHIDSTMDEEAWKLLKERRDKTWSLTDCASFVVMGKRKIITAFTTDHHFEQAGYVKILK